MGEIVAEAPPWMWMDALAVARAGYAAVEANRPLCVPGAPNRAVTAFARLLPEEWGLSIMGRRTRGRR